MDDTEKSKIKQALNVLNEETSGLLHPYTEVIQLNWSEIAGPQWPLKFHRDYVSKNCPVLIKGGCQHFGAVRKWDSDYFMTTLPNKEVIVAVTPNGYADGLLEANNTTYFVTPEEVPMTIAKFIDLLNKPRPNYVSYIQRQNSNLTEDFNELMPDVDEDISWASETFDKKPDAINFWMGDKRAITSMHKDPYENIYCVVDGFKDFILIPPTDLAFMPHEVYPCGTYQNVLPDDGGYNLDITQTDGITTTIRWVAVDPLNPSHLVKYPEFRNAHKYKVRVAKGDCLYLPSLWWHHVSQSHKCIAVNYWYDMDFDVKYCYYKMLEALLIPSS